MSSVTESISIEGRPSLRLLRWPIEGKGADVVLCLHGAESHSEWFSPIAERLVQQGFEVAAFDRSGWGQSPGTRGDMGILAEQVGDVIAVADSLRLHGQRVHLVGMSWGALLAARAVFEKSNIFSSLTLLSPGIFTTWKVNLSVKIRILFSYWFNHVSFLALPYRPEDFAHDVQAQIYIGGDKFRVTEVSVRFAMATYLLQKEVASLEERFALPTMVLLGRDDKMIDIERTVAWAQELGCTLAVLPIAKHSLQFDQADDVAARLANHIRRA